MNETTSTLVGSVSDALANVPTIYTAAVDMVTGNVISLAFIGMALVGAGLRLFGRTMHTR